MLEIIAIILISLPLLLLGKTISPNSTIILGTKIPQEDLESEKGIIGLRRIKNTFILSGTITLVGGILCIIFNWFDFIFWFMFLPLTIAVIIMLIQLCIIHGDKRSGIVITIVSIVLIVVTPLMIMGPTFENDEKIEIRNDTLFIGGLYSKFIPVSDIVYINENAIVPFIKLRTNGISLGSYNVGHFRTKENKDVLLYLHSNKTNVTYIKTINNEDIYINLRDSTKSVNLSTRLKEIYFRNSIKSN